MERKKQELIELHKDLSRSFNLEERFKIEHQERWRDWADVLPDFSFPAEWLIRFIPPFAGALMRFKVRHLEGFVSVYFDGFERLGYGGGPYWEVYPDADFGDVARFAMDDWPGVVECIRDSLTKQNEGKR